MASSTSGALWSSLYYLYFVIAAIVGVLVVGWVLYAMWKFRWRPDTPRPADAPQAGMIAVERGHPLWSYVMAGVIALVMFGLAFGTISAVQTMEVPPDEGDRVYHDVIGYQFGWKYNYTGIGGIPFQVLTPGRDQFVVPVETNVLLNITSQDVWHNFAIPEFRHRVDAIPGTVNTLWFRALETGEFRNVCVVICGVNHAKMHTMMKVVTKEEYQTWLAERSEEEFQNLEERIYRDARRGTVVNATIDESSLALERANVTVDRPIIFNITNNGGQALGFVVDGGYATTVPAGGRAYLYAVAAEVGQITVAANGERVTLEVVPR